MDFFASTVGALQTIVIALGAVICIWGGVNLAEAYSQNDPASRSQGIKQLVAGGGVIFIGITLVPQLTGLFS